MIGAQERGKEDEKRKREGKGEGGGKKEEGEKIEEEEKRRIGEGKKEERERKGLREILPATTIKWVVFKTKRASSTLKQFGVVYIADTPAGGVPSGRHYHNEGNWLKKRLKFFAVERKLIKPNMMMRGRFHKDITQPGQDILID